MISYNGRYYADYGKAVATAEEVLEDYGIIQVPLQLDIILDALSNEVALMPYSRFMGLIGVTYQEVIRLMDSDLGSCAYDPQTSRYVIYYNDQMSEGVNRFTIAHELGHIFLEHHFLAGTDVLSRNYVPKQQYKEFENEANAFARNLLSPAPLAKMVVKNREFSDVMDVEKAFFITSTAAQTRIDFLKKDLPLCTPKMTSYIMQIQIMEYLSSCKQCGYALPEVAEFCPSCGSTKRKRQFFFKTLPTPIYIDAYHSLLMCPHCGNTDLSLGAQYCRICGSPAINVCMGHKRGRFAGQRHYNPHYARFCLVCGAKTVFQTYNVLREDIEYMHPAIEYNDGVPYDEETLRVEQCPRCHNRQFSQNALYCRICGMDLYNRCDGMEQDNFGNWYSNEEARHRNPSNARFCETCGRPTFFLDQKILCAYTDFKPEDVEDTDDDGWLYQNNVYGEIAAAPESEGYIPEQGDLEVSPETVTVDTDELPF